MLPVVITQTFIAHAFVHSHFQIVKLLVLGVTRVLLSNWIPHLVHLNKFVPQFIELNRAVRPDLVPHFVDFAGCFDKF